MSKHFVQCPKCGIIEAPGNSCPKCFEEKPRGPFIVQDTLPYPRKLVSLHGMPMVESNSDIRRAMKRHDQVHGTALFQP